MQNLFVQNRKQFSWNIGITSIVLVGSLYLFGHLLNQHGITAQTELPRIGSFLLYGGLLFLFLMFRNRQQSNEKIWFLGLIRLVLLAVIGVLGLKYGVQGVMLLVISAYLEEFMKMGATQTQIKKADFFSSDVITFSVLIALGFSIVENLLFLGHRVFAIDSQGLLAMLL